MFNPKMEILNQRRISNDNKFPIFTKFLIFFTIIFGVVAPLFSQGQLSVVVTDSEKFPLPGVTVTLRGPALKGERIGVTGAQGKYNFTDLPFGSYQIKFEMAGFKTLIRENVNVSATSIMQEVSLELARIEEEITVYAISPVVNISRSERSVLNETSLSLHHNIDQTWSQLTEAPNIDTQRQILTDASRYWFDNLAETQYALLSSAKAKEKQSTIKAIFGEIFQRLNVSFRRAQSSEPIGFKGQTEMFLTESSQIADTMAIMAASGEPSFDLKINSIPAGAKVLYWYGNARPVEHHEETPTIIENLKYVKWHIELKLDGYPSEEKCYDPFRDKCHTIWVVFRKKESSYLY